MTPWHGQFLVPCNKTLVKLSSGSCQQCVMLRLSTTLTKKAACLSHTTDPTQSCKVKTSRVLAIEKHCLDCHMPNDRQPCQFLPSPAGNQSLHIAHKARAYLYVASPVPRLCLHWFAMPMAAWTNPKSAKRALPSLHKSTLACTGSLVHLT